MTTWPSEVYSQTITTVKDGVTYTHKRATMLDKDFVLSCWDESSPIGDRIDRMTESQFYDLIIQKSLFNPPPGKVPMPFEGYAPSILRADGTPVAYHHCRIRRLQDREEDGLITDKGFVHVHADHRRKGYSKIMQSLLDYSGFTLYDSSKVTFSVLDSSIAAKKVHTALGAVYHSSEQTNKYGEVHNLEALKSTWEESRKQDGLTYTVSSEYIPITDSRWATPAVTLDTGTRKWNDI